ncbi:TIGR01777 family oxidoreductase [Allonocardiopsis opalescens]|uniref:TIGR01777 family protein n=1 Tax=Allonocardiopsis opalescens TaxID=1144618 RepID=A0A2T0PZV2_9ACTN|nr:TIGR01777 family oxidoreductase [Allonocardiopsis opalescens]PRX97079.1 hypothetical protein CLV72_106115 [Allonocardiopsis opalescens]
MRIAISGASGLVGAALSQDLTAAGHEVLHLVRRPARTSAEVAWDPAGQRVDTERLEGTDAVVHLAGAPIGPRRWTHRYKVVLHDSRVPATRTLATALAGMRRPPSALLSASAVGYYGDTGRAAVDEDSGASGTDFLAALCRRWEEAAGAAAAGGVRVVNLRSGIVLDRRGGMLGTVLPLFRLGLGGPLGDGRQYVSWISLRDEVAAIRFLLDHDTVRGAVDLTAPHPVTNAEYTRAIGRALRRPTPLPVPAVAMRAVFGDFADSAALVSQRVLPARLTDAGFTFAHPDIDSALRAVLG